MSESKSPRPRQVTVAAWLIMAGSVFVVLSVFDQVATMHSLETRRSVEDFLDQPPGSDLGIGVDAMIDLLRVVAMVAGGCATAAAILGYQVLQRSRAARVALTVLAGPLFLAGLVAGGFMSSIVAASVVMLWFQPARDWFAGRTPPAAPPSSARTTRTAPPAPPAPTGRPVGGDTPPPPPPSSSPSSSGEPRAYAGFGSPAPTGQPWAPPSASPYAAPGAAASAARPAAVVWACALTWVTSGLVAIGMALSALVFALDPDPVFAELRRQQPELLEAGVSRDLLVTGVITLAAGAVVWCLAAVVVAWFAFRRARWAHVTLLVFAAAAGAVSLLGTLLGSFPLVVPLFACVAAVALLSRRPVRGWFAGDSPAGR